MNKARTLLFGLITNPGTYMIIAGAVIFITVPLDLVGVEGVIEPGTGYLMLAVTAFIGLVTMAAGLLMAVEEREMHG